MTSGMFLSEGRDFFLSEERCGDGCEVMKGTTTPPGFWVFWVRFPGVALRFTPGYWRAPLRG
jgi:hypothetical protein